MSFAIKNVSLAAKDLQKMTVSDAERGLYSKKKNRNAIAIEGITTRF